MRERLLRGALCATLLATAVCVAAVVAHVGIDVVGDFALPHDAYDDVAHTSRLGIVVAAIGLLLAGAFGVLWSAFDSARRRAEPGRRLRIVAHPFAFCASAVCLTVLAVAAMESLDAWIAHAPLDGIDDMLGGSVVLGLAVAIPAALAAAYAALRLARCIERTRLALVRVIESLIWRVAPRRASSHVRAARTNAPLLHFSGTYLRGVPKRGPPLFA